VAPAAATLLDAEIGEWYGSDFGRRFVHPEDYDTVSEHTHQGFESGEPSEMEFRMVAKTGRIVWVRSFFNPRVRPDGSKVMQGFLLDITQEKQAAEENTRLAAFPRENPHMILEVEPTGELVYANPAASRFLDESGIEEVRRVLPDNHAELVALVLASHDQSQFAIVDCGGRKIRWHYLAIAMLGRVHLYGLDVTEQVKAQEELDRRNALIHRMQRLEIFGCFAAGIVHDFRNLLTIMKGCQDMLKDEAALSMTGREYLEKIAVACERGKNLTSQLLSHSKSRGSAMATFDLNVLVLKTMDLCERLLGKLIEIRMDLTAEPLPVHADPEDVAQALCNLARNSADAMPRGGVFNVTTRRVYCQDTGRPEARMVISDTGCGIPLDNLQRIFDPFFSTKEREGGTGLGLFNVREIVYRSGGRISANSRPGAGTTFEIGVPIDEPGAATGDTVREQPTPRFGQATILLVDDEEGIRDLAEKVLASHGFRVLCCANADTAVSMSGSHDGKIDVALVDIVMPEMSGALLATILRRQRPELEVVLMSAYDPDVYLNRSGHRQESKFLKKPFEVEELLTIVRSALDAT
jgi:signal transduction histidine kinase